MKEALSEQEVLWALGISMMPGVGNVTAKRLVAFCGGLEAVYRHNQARLQSIPGIGPAIARAVVEGRALHRAEKELQFAQRNGIRVLPYLDPDYPRRLIECDDGPLVLFVKGAGELNLERMVAVVGTRRPSEYGRRMAVELVGRLASSCRCIVSGLAYGIDIEAHRAAMDHAVPTVAVLAHGLDRIYPAMHSKLANRMLEQGNWVSEFAMGTLPERENFPQRNRIIAGLSDAVVVVEAGRRGGALITADLADGYHRDVFAFPGRADDPMSEGCNQLIRSNRAGLITSAEELLYAMGWDASDRREVIQGQLFPHADPETASLWDLLREPATIDQLAGRTGMRPGRIGALLLDMELEGLVQLAPGNIWRRS